MIPEMKEPQTETHSGSVQLKPEAAHHPPAEPEAGHPALPHAFFQSRSKKLNIREK